MKNTRQGKNLGSVPVFVPISAAPCLKRLVLLAGAASVFVSPIVAQPDMKRGGLAGEKAKEKVAEKAPANNPNNNVVTVQNWTLGTNNANPLNEESVRQSLQMQGITDEATQNAVIEHVNRLKEARQAIEAKVAALRANLQPDVVMADAQFNVMLNDYLAAVEDYHTIREKSEQQLNAKIGYLKNPRLQAKLLILGLIGQAPAANNALNPYGNWTTMLQAPVNGNFLWNFDFQGLPNGGAMPRNLLIQPGNNLGAFPQGHPFVFRTPQFPQANGVFIVPPPAKADEGIVINQGQEFFVAPQGQPAQPVNPRAVPNPFNPPQPPQKPAEKVP